MDSFPSLTVTASHACTATVPASNKGEGQEGSSFFFIATSRNGSAPVNVKVGKVRLFSSSRRASIDQRQEG
jgi:hypothetical protein